MSEFQTEAEFAKQVNTDFRVELESPRPIELRLIDVRGRASEPHEQAGM